MVFSPLASTAMTVVPLGPRTWRTYWVSTPASVSLPSRKSALASDPTAPKMRTFAPMRAAAAAWLPDLPPGSTCRGPPLTVSPGPGRRSVETV